MRRNQAKLIGLALSLGLALGGCENLDSLFNSKKLLPGDRRAVFPDGVPGVPQGVPPELVRGYQPPPEPEPPPVVVEKPKPKSKPKRVAAPAQPVTGITVRPAAQRPSASPFPPPAQPAPSNSSPFPPPPSPPR